MCGIVGMLCREGGEPPVVDELAGMVAAIHHRGPEASAAYLDDRVGLGFARLSIIDLVGGLQPLTNETNTIWLVCNGEIYNYVELRAGLLARGHRFRTGSDCETILHLYEERGLDALQALNGDFAFALWDRAQQQLILARDRVGVRPLFYSEVGGRLVFGSEIKALLTLPEVPRQIDMVALGQVFTTWSPVPPRTMFEGVYSLRPGHALVWSRQGRAMHQYWRLMFPPEGPQSTQHDEEAAACLRELLQDATRLRLRADVPVGAYVSGGLDSAVVGALAQRCSSTPLRTFSVAFASAEFDERTHQDRVARTLGTQHQTLVCSGEDIAGALPEVIWHTETPLLRTAPVPLFLLAGLVRASGLKVVLTGEGADEFLVGYDIFKEAKVRAFWARQPASVRRPLLLQRIYGHIPELAHTSQAYRQAFFGAGLDRVGSPAFSHMLRWGTPGQALRSFSPQVRALCERAGNLELQALLDEQGANWHPVARAQFNEVTTFLDPYLLSSQGDRVAMAHAVEGRFPFLDYRVIEFCNALPPETKLRGLSEKAVLKRAIADLVPTEIIDRTKQPFRAPIQDGFCGPGAPAYVAEVLDPARIAADGVFNPKAASWLLERSRQAQRMSERENMVLAGMITFGLFQRCFLDEFQQRRVRSADIAVIADYRSPAVAAPVIR